jgi:hypothetical protein
VAPQAPAAGAAPAGIAVIGTYDDAAGAVTLLRAPLTRRSPHATMTLA